MPEVLSRMTVPEPLSDGEAARLADAQTEISPDTIVTGIEDGKFLGVADGKVVGVDAPEGGIIEEVDFPFGWQQVTAWTDDVVNTNLGTWLKCNGQEVDIEEFPNLENTTAIIEISNKITPNMTANNVPSPYVASSSSSYDNIPGAWRAFSGVSDAGWSSNQQTFNASGITGF